MQVLIILIVALQLFASHFVVLCVGSLHPIHHQSTALPPKYVKLSNRAPSTIEHHLQYQHHQQLQQQQNQQKRAGLLEKICIGTSNRMSAGQHNKTDHYQSLADRYRNCTYVIGNLEITWLEKSSDKKPIDLSFLESIIEITGYLLIAHVDVPKISMPNLQIIRGRDLFRLNNDQKEEFAMFLIDNELETLELPNLREILAGSVGSYNNRNLCHLRSIYWEEILSVPMYKPIFSSYGNQSQPHCPACDPSCNDACWAEGPEMCQKFSKTNCSPQCSQGRCFGSLPSECCHLFCAGGCTGPKQTDCLACKNFYNDGECIQECPSMQRYNPSKFLWEPNPNGKYAFGGICVKECPEHLFRDNGACVRTCPPNKRSINGECQACTGPCPKNCQGVEVVHSRNIDQLINCTVIEGSITILDTSFTGYADVYSNNTIGTKYEPMHPSKLEVFKTIREITGFLNIQANHSDFKDLSCFRNLRTITGRQVTDMNSALSITKTSLVSLNLRSLRKIKSGRITIEENRDLCFVDTIDWLQTNITKREDITTRNNADIGKCRDLGLQCHEQCARDGCWGPGPDECLSCKNYKLDDFCVDNCTSTEGILSYDAGGNICQKCHSECELGCTGTEAHHCLRCKNVKDGPHCVEECPSHKYNNDGICEECDKNCVDGCTGPSNRLGEGGCNACGKAVINSTSLVFSAHCIRAEDNCPEGYYREYIGTQVDGPLKSSSGKPVCRKCHNRCKSCTGMGTHVSVCSCAKYEAGEQCEDVCPRDYFADENRKRCIRCSPECNGCYGPTEADCISCRVYRIYHDASYISSSSNIVTAIQLDTSPINKNKIANLYENNGKQQQAKFNCTAQCPQNKPYRISDDNMLDPYCSENPGTDIDNASIVSFGGTSLLFMSIITAAIMFCIYVHKCQIEKDSAVKWAQQMTGFEDSEPLEISDRKPNLAHLNSIKETELSKGKKLGRGFGGTVYQGLWVPEDQPNEKKIVAIKVLHDNGQPNMNKEFLDEAYMMASVNHPNLVKLMAICMTPTSQMLVTQLMPLGGLLEFVKTNKSKISSKELLEWSKQIAKGMAYLEENHMVHRDLALRNVLLQKRNKAVISDFGLAKILEINQNEYQSNGGRLPIKWLAPECIRERKFTHKSDVWAFGVTVWELLTFGQKPFEEYEMKDVPLAIEKGARLQQPPHVSAEVYKVMYACWFPNPETRPHFRGLTDEFVNFARDPGRYLICGTKGIGYKLRSVSSSGKDKLDGCPNTKCLDESEENYGSAHSLDNDDEEPPLTAMSTLPDLTPTTNNRMNEMFGFEMRHTAGHHLSESDAHHTADQHQQHLSPTLKNHHASFYHNQQIHDDDEEVFVDEPASMMSHQHLVGQNGKSSSNLFVTDANNNNNFIQNNNCWSIHHTLSTNSLGHKSEQPTDTYDYLLPSPCTNIEQSHFSNFYTCPTYESKSTHASTSIAPIRNPPHSAGLAYVNNEEYFLNYLSNQSTSGEGGSGRHLESKLDNSRKLMSTSNGNIPHSLV